jgi:DNA-binding response OmpR family regulator
MTLSGSAYVEEISAMRRRVETLEAELHMYRSKEGALNEARNIERLCNHYDLKPQQAKFLLMLSDGSMHSRWDLELTLSPDSESGKVLHVIICRVRKKVAPHTIKTAWGRGYQASPELAAEIQRVLK